jgi:hypothetical protein
VIGFTIAERKIGEIDANSDSQRLPTNDEGASGQRRLSMTTCAPPPLRSSPTRAEAGPFQGVTAWPDRSNIPTPQ